MKQLKLFVFAFALTFGTYTQVRVNTTTQQTTFEMIANHPTGTTTDEDGLLPPKVDREHMQSMVDVPTGTIVYCDKITTVTETGTTINVTQVGSYNYNSTDWASLIALGDLRLANSKVTLG